MCRCINKLDNLEKSNKEYWQEYYKPDNMIQRELDKLPKTSKLKVSLKIQFKWIQDAWNNFKQYTKGCIK